MSKEQEGPQHDSQLYGVRSRAVVFTKYALWALSFAFAVLAGNAYLGLIQRWLTLLETARRSLGVPRPGAGPDWWLSAGLGIALAFPFVLVAAIYWRLQKHLESRLRDVWQSPTIPPYAKIRPLLAGTSGRELRKKIGYVREIRSKPAWLAGSIPDPGESQESYRRAAEAMLAELEKDVSARAIALGLVVGVSRNRATDLFTIAAAALELQIHVLTRLGKRPSLAVWREMLTRTASSMFLNCYLNQDESLALRIAIRKMGMGLEAASELIDRATTFAGDHLDRLLDSHDATSWDLDDADWDDLDLIPHDILGVPVKPLIEAGRLATGTLVGIGTFGMRQLGAFIDSAGDELFQGALAGGILYFHGMAIAADCLALNRRHRDSAAMTRTVGHCMASAAGTAGHVLRDAIRSLRKVLKEKRRRAITFGVGEKTGGMWRRVKAKLTESLPAEAGGAEAEVDTKQPLRPMQTLRNLGTCPECGQRLKAGAKFCSHCGCRVFGQRTSIKSERGTAS